MRKNPRTCGMPSSNVTHHFQQHHELTYNPKAMIIRYPPSSAFRLNGLSTVCLLCLHSAALAPSRTATRNFSRTSIVQAVVVVGSGTRLGEGYFSGSRPRDGFFSGNRLLEKALRGGRRGNLTSAIPGPSSIAVGSGASKLSSSRSPELPTTSIKSTEPELLPHRQRAAARKAAASADLELPENSSTTLSESASKAAPNSIRRLLPVLLSLSKPRLSVLVVLTACATYSLYPVPELLLTSVTDTPSLSPLTLLFLTTGTALCAASASAFNMLYEPKWDAMMSRTRNRPLVRGLISTRGAALFAILAGVSGTTALYFGVNPTVSFLGGLNVVLYAGVYTPMKRISCLNTWVGAVVGGIPPLMGWAAAAGQSATEGNWRELLLGEQNIGGWLLATLLLAWQFPHFMSLSWSIREEYKNAGYKMLCWVNPARNGRVALRYSLLFFPICFGLCYYNVTEWTFAAASTPINLWLVKEAVRFWRLEGQKGSARGLFWASVWHLPIVMILAMVEKKGMWQRVWRAAMGQPNLDEDEEWVDEDEEEAVLSAKPGEVQEVARKVAISMPGR